MTREDDRKSSSASDAALYIASIADELSRLAKNYDLDSLAFILEMARLEADEVSKHWDDPRGRGKDLTREV